MALEPKTSRIPLSPSSQGTSAASPGQSEPQLSGPAGVETSVSTAALDRGMLMAATTPPPSAAFLSALAGAESDAEIMLRAKVGDSSAFDYLVQKYRRP